MAGTHDSDTLIREGRQEERGEEVNMVIREERQEERGEEVNMVRINEGTDSLPEGSGSQGGATGLKDLYATPDLTKKVRRGDRGTEQRGDNEDRGQLELREETETRVNIYEHVGDLRGRDVAPGPQMDNTAGSQSLGQQTVGRRLKDAAPWILGVILLILVVVTGVAAHYDTANKLLQIRDDKLVLKERLETRLNNLTQENTQLQHEVTQLREAADKVCPNGWQKFGFRCYQRSPDAKTWVKSRQHCLKAGGDLAIINRQKEQEFIKELSSGQVGSWIGLNKTEGNWTWVDGKPLTTGYWASGRPKNNTNNNCVKYNHKEGDWEDAICEEDFRFICEK